MAECLGRVVRWGSGSINRVVAGSSGVFEGEKWTGVTSEVFSETWNGRLFWGVSSWGKRRPWGRRNKAKADWRWGGLRGGGGVGGGRSCVGVRGTAIKVRPWRERANVER